MSRRRITCVVLTCRKPQFYLVFFFLSRCGSATSNSLAFHVQPSHCAIDCPAMSSRKDSDHSLKALVFVDSCGADSSPLVGNFTSLLNLPVLSWQLGVLARYGVKEAIVLSSEPVESIYQDPLGRMKVTALSSKSWSNEGDAIREIESRDDLRPVDDFVLVRQGAVFNVDVSQLVTAHKRRREADRNWLITTVLRKGAGSASSGLAVCVDTASGTLLKYVEEMDKDGVLVDTNGENSGLQNGGSVEICSDVMDIGLDVCAPEFLVEFRENFYYDTVRAYIIEKLEGGEAEVFGNRMYAHYIDSSGGQYATRIFSLASLAQATSDLLNGWMYPITCSNINGISKEEKLPDFQSEFLLEQSVIGDNVSIAIGSTVIDSVIGDNVKIGSDVTIKHSILMEGVVIGDRSDVEGSIISKGCAIRENSSVPTNCFLDEGVCIGADFMDMVQHSLITLKDPEKSLEDTENEDDTTETNETALTADSSSKNNGDSGFKETCEVEHVGEGGKGRLVDDSLSMKIDHFFIPRGIKLDSFESDEEDEIEEDDEVGGFMREQRADDANGEISALGEDIDVEPVRSAPGEDPEISRIAKFNLEVLETIERAYELDVEVDNTALEVNSLKLAYHCSFPETLTGIVVGLTQIAVKSSATERVYGAIDAALKKYEIVIKKFNKDGDAAHHIQVASRIAKSFENNGTIVMYVYKAMYDRDMLEEEGILGWAAAEREKMEAGKGNSDLLNAVSPLLEWLENSDDDDDEED